MVRTSLYLNLDGYNPKKSVHWLQISVFDVILVFSERDFNIAISVCFLKDKSFYTKFYSIIRDVNLEVPEIL